ncbi:MAG: molybdopterin-dependent oxidoreductase [Nitrospinae bacterium]|nr:molybdopterin-dependent oxidoreductase [Nitrospinota bacterium]
MTDQPKNTVTLTIDGVSVTVEKGKKIYDAAIKAGIYLPGLCYDPKLTRFGGCRMCVVEITRKGRTQSKWACCEPASDGVEVVTNSPRIRKKQQVMMEFLLAAHPLDCPTCNASGSCGLQDAAYFIKQTRGRIPLKRRDEPLLIDNPVIERDYNKCIMCGKCVVICDEVQGNGAIGFQKRGYNAEVGTPFRIPLVCDYCGQCLHVCPVGSIQDHTERYKGHAWEYEKTNTICPYCAVGCTIVANVKRGDLAKVTSNDWIGVNNGNLCARGRFGHGFVQSAQRLRQPVMRRGEAREPVEWERALDSIAARIKETVERHGPGAVAAIAGEGMPLEDAYLLQKVMRAGFGAGRIETLSNLRSPALNSGLFDTFGALAPVTGYDFTRRAGAFFFFGADAEKENPVIANMVRPVMRDHDTPLFVANARDILFAPKERARLRYRYGAETALLAALTAVAKGGAADAALLTAADVDGEAFARLAGGLKAAGAPLVFLGKEIHDHPRSEDIVKAAVELAAALGGRALLYREYANTMGANDMGLSSTHLPGYLPAGDPDAAERYARAWGRAVPVYAAAGPLFGALERGEIKTLVVAGCDPVSALYGAEWKGLIQNVEYLAATAPFDNETTKLAHVTLPTQTAMERPGMFTNNEGRVQLLRRAAPPQQGAWAEWEIFQELGRRVGMPLYAGPEKVAEEIARVVPGYEGLTHSKVTWGGSLVDYASRAGGPRALAFSTAPVAWSADGAHPLLALIGNSLYHLGILSPHAPALVEIDPRAWVEAHPEDAAGLGLRDGDEVVVESRNGAIHAMLKTTYRSPRGIVYIMKNFSGAPAAHLPAHGDAAARVALRKA